PHISLVHGEDNVDFLKRRHEALSKNPLFQGMDFTDDPEKLKEWIPLIMEGRNNDQPVAATKIDGGTDVNLGVLTRKLLNQLENENAGIHYNRTVEDVERLKDGRWSAKVRYHAMNTLENHKAKVANIDAVGAA